MHRFTITAALTTRAAGGLLLTFLCTCPVYAESPSPRDAVARIEEIGGAVRPVAGNSGEWEVEFHLRGRKLTDEGLASIAKLKNIAVLNLRDTKITDAGLVHLKGLTQLRRLHLERTEVRDEGMEHLSGLVNLEYLNLYGTKVTDKWIAASNAADAPKSENGLNTQVFFENQSKNRVKLYWVSYGNELNLYAELDLMPNLDKNRIQWRQSLLRSLERQVNSQADYAQFDHFPKMPQRLLPRF